MGAVVEFENNGVLLRHYLYLSYSYMWISAGRNWDGLIL